MLIDNKSARLSPQRHANSCMSLRPVTSALAHLACTMSTVRKSEVHPSARSLASPAPAHNGTIQACQDSGVIQNRRAWHDAVALTTPALGFAVARGCTQKAGPRGLPVYSVSPWPVGCSPAGASPGPPGPGHVGRTQSISQFLSRGRGGGLGLELFELLHLSRKAKRIRTPWEPPVTATAAAESQFLNCCSCNWKAVAAGGLRARASFTSCKAAVCCCRAEVLISFLRRRESQDFF